MPRSPRLPAAALAFVLPWLLSLGGGCAATRSYNYRAEPDPAKVQYTIGPGDMIEVRQWKNPDVSGRLRVMPDGTITVPLVGAVQAAGLTVQKLRESLSAALSRYISSPPGMETMTVSVDEFQAYAISVLGEVNQPGHYQPGHYVNVLEALALAHGLTPYAQGDKIVILRGEGGAARRIPLSYATLAAGKRPEMNLNLLRGDVIVVP